MRYDWSPEKNEQLKRQRGVTFEQVLFRLSEGAVWKVADHPNQRKYPGQNIYFVNMDGYIYLVPHVVEKECVFLKTIIPSRKATRDYRRESDENQD